MQNPLQQIEVTTQLSLDSQTNNHLQTSNGNQSSLSPNQLHQQFKTYGQNAKVWTNKCLFMLPEIIKHQVWKNGGFENIYDYALKLAGISKYKVDLVLWILNSVEAFPLIKEIAYKKGINAVRPIVTILTKDTENFWAEKLKS